MPSAVPAHDEPSPGGEGSVRGPDALLRSSVFTLVCRHMGTLAGRSAGDYEDLVQVASEKALAALPTFRGDSSLSTWVYRVCSFVLQNQRRSYRRWLRHFTLSLTGELPEPVLDPPDDLEGAERRQRLQRAMERVSPKLSVVVTLHDLYGLSVAEIAEAEGIGELTVRSRLRDGRKELLRRLEADPYFGRRAVEARLASPTTGDAP